jgi:hypothetical protein
MRYNNGIRSFSYDTSAIASIQDTYTKNVYPGQPQFAPGSRETIGSTTGWSNETIRNLESINSYAILDSIVSLLLGNYNQIPIPVGGPQFNTTLLNGTELQWDPVEAGVSFWDRWDPQNGSLPSWFFGYGGEIRESRSSRHQATTDAAQSHR